MDSWCIGCGIARGELHKPGCLVGSKVQYEAVNHPAHYNAGDIEHCEMVEDQGAADGYYFGQVTKYLFRSGRKPGTEAIQDLLKSQWYMNRWVAWRQHGKKIWKIAKHDPEITLRPDATPEQK